jgi:hypothetical protein
MNLICCPRAFKTAWFARAARKAHIRDATLLKAAREVMRGQADDLGGGVYKKRLNDNQHRSIVLAKGGVVWVFAFLYAKKDRANIDPDELVEFRRIAKEYARMSASGLNRLIEAGDLLEVRDDH